MECVEKGEKTKMMKVIRKGPEQEPRLIEKKIGENQEIIVSYLEFETFKKQSWLTHAFSTRLGGESWRFCVYEPGIWTW